MKVYIYIALAVLVWGTTSVIEKTIIDRINPFALLFWHVVSAMICISILMLASGPLRSTIASAGSKVIIIACITGVLGGCIGVILFFKALALGQVSVVVPLTATYPLITMFLAYMVIREPITVVKAVGTVMIVAGCFLLSKELT